MKSVAWFICEHPGQLISQTQGFKIQTIEKKFLCRYYTPSNTKYIPNICQILGWKSTLREESAKSCLFPGSLHLVEGSCFMLCGVTIPKEQGCQLQDSWPSSPHNGGPCNQPVPVLLLATAGSTYHSARERRASTERRVNKTTTIYQQGLCTYSTSYTWNTIPCNSYLW